MGKRLKLLIFIVAYNAQDTILDVLSRIPSQLKVEFEYDILVIDDSSKDMTFALANDLKTHQDIKNLYVLYNPVNQGYGGNQKIGYHFAIKNGYDFVALLHADGQYAPESLPDILQPLSNGRADAVFGSRMMTPGGALKGGMPLYKFVGNKILTRFENLFLGTGLSEFHSGYRAYSVEALKKIPFHLNTNDFHFDTEIIIQFVIARLRIVEIPIPTYYGNEICHVNGLKYARDVMKTVIKARVQRLGIFYDRRFDCAGKSDFHDLYRLKEGFLSPHVLCLTSIQKGSRVLDLGCSHGYLGEQLRKQLDCHVTGVDIFPLPKGMLDEFIQWDLNCGLPPLDYRNYQYILLLDVIEHLACPEVFIDRLRDVVKLNPSIKILASTANIAFFINRLSLMFGAFNYGHRGILDKTHARLFTFASFHRLFEQGGFIVTSTIGIPAPFPLAFGSNRISKLLMEANRFLLSFRSGLFSYQIFMVVKPLPSLDYLLKESITESHRRSTL